MQTEPQDVILSISKIKSNFHYSFTTTILQWVALKLLLLFSLQNYGLFLNNLFQSTLSPPDPSWFFMLHVNILLLKTFCPLFLTDFSLQALYHSITATVWAGTSFCHTCTWYCGFLGGKVLKIPLFFQTRGRQQLLKQKLSYSRDIRDISREEYIYCSLRCSCEVPRSCQSRTVLGGRRMIT